MNALSDVHPSPNRQPTHLGRWGLFWHRSRTRRALLNLDAQQLKDVGLNPEMATHEARKPFWRS
ncbi:hypothetical protein AQS70_19655 [Pseudomonas endophytica]|uniref:YjiS-like domain-containing protein n=1 Tax=Pseudomonas endophytica TaxID=1563157 RepID=A0A0N8VT43_9PSED|nr:DUF1127 domain-containing protein [Pseudomonas endophytica]KQB55084.1 hypothetical protein AQS70_19655 [Pseudomonas endophytica]